MVRGLEQSVSPSRFLDELPEEGVVKSGAEERALSAQDFAAEMDRILRRQRASLRILSEGGEEELAPGVRVSHPRYGEGEIVAVSMVGKRRMVRVRFDEQGIISLLLASGAVSPG